MATKPKKTEQRVSAERVARHLQGRFNPIRGLTPEKLAGLLDGFDAGHLRGAALVWDKVARRDDAVVTVKPKRELAASLLDWEIVAVDDSPEAGRHKEALEAFYNSLTATDAIDRNRRGGVSMLIRQMMSAVGMKYAAHEIVWDPRGAELTATFVHVPLWFFENTTGRLRFLADEHSRHGEDLDADGWLVTVGDGLMEATAVAYMFKNLPLKDWLIYSEKFGMPGTHGKTSAAEGSEEWNRFAAALAAYGAEYSILTDLNAQIEKLDFTASGTQPHPALVERMDRAITAIWRGGDLSTMSRGGEGVGALPQMEEKEILEQADALMVTEALNEQVDRAVVRYRLGADQPLAWFKLMPKQRLNIDREVKIDEFLIKHGVPRGIADLAEKYGRALPDEGEEVASTAAPALSPLGNARRESSLISEALADALDVAPEWLAPLGPFLERLEAAGTGAVPDLDEMERIIVEELPELLDRIDPEALAKVFEEALASAVIAGLSDAPKSNLNPPPAKSRNES